MAREKLTPSEAAAVYEAVKAQAEAAKAQYPQYRGYWDRGNGWFVVEVTRRVRTKMGVAFEKGDRTIARPCVEGYYAGDSPCWTAYSVRNGIDTSISFSWARPLEPLFAAGDTVRAVYPNGGWGVGTVVEDDPAATTVNPATGRRIYRKPLIVERADGTRGHFHYDQIAPYAEASRGGDADSRFRFAPLTSAGRTSKAEASGEVSSSRETRSAP